jgi:hypothetical protein
MVAWKLESHKLTCLKGAEVIGLLSRKDRNTAHEGVAETGEEVQYIRKSVREEILGTVELLSKDVGSHSTQAQC